MSGDVALEARPQKTAFCPTLCKTHMQLTLSPRLVTDSPAWTCKKPVVTGSRRGVCGELLFQGWLGWQDQCACSALQGAGGSGAPGARIAAAVVRWGWLQCTLHSLGTCSTSCLNCRQSCLAID